MQTAPGWLSSKVGSPLNRSCRSPYNTAPQRLCFVLTAGARDPLLLLSTPASLAFAEAWNATAAVAVQQGKVEEEELLPLEGEAYVTCSSLRQCQCTSLSVSASGCGPLLHCLLPLSGEEVATGNSATGRV